MPRCFQGHRLQVLIVGAACVLLTACAGEPAKKTLSKEERARLYVEAANSALSEGDPVGALQFLKGAENEDSDLPEIYHSRSLAYFAKKDYEAATQEARKAVKIAPNYTEANNTLGKLLLDAGNYAEAEKYLTRAANDPLYRDSYKPHTSLGILHYRRDEFERAANNLDKAIAEQPTFACVAYYYRGHIRLRQGQFKEASKDYFRATQKACAGFADAHLALGISYERNKQYEQARKKYLDIRQSFPESKVAEQALERMRFLP